MQIDAGLTTSIWATTAQMPQFPSLSANQQADVCVIGAGIAGITTAYLLSRAGRSVMVLDDGPVGGGETGRTTAHLVNALDDRYFEIERLHGERGARLAAESHTAAIDLIESIVNEEQIDCEFERLDGYLFLAPGESREILERELEATHRAGLTEMEMVEKAPLESFDTGPSLRFPRQAQFHPLKYLAKLAQVITRSGGQIFTNTHAREIYGGPAGRVITNAGHTVTADAIVVATNTPVNDIVTIHTKQAAYRTYVIGVQVPRDSVTKALYWDTLDPYHYLRLESMTTTDRAGNLSRSDILIVGGEDHKTGQDDDADERYRQLEAWTRERFPIAEQIAFRWSGQIIEPIDGLAFIGLNPTGEENVYIATGDSGNGMTHGTIAGRLLTDLILGRENAWATLYDPSRITLRAAKEFIQENANVAAQYTDWATAGEVNSLAEIAPGSGAILRRGLTKVAAYRDESGRVHELSAVCTHLGCIVDWNSGEKTWDCPCHGSRFDPYGRIVNGPAITNLQPVESYSTATKSKSPQ
jgi:glycine/D-amino acid oxidase-like deaminating enzyme/nitrite reductase/ring-hydroxylating ferredoxin subunit